MNDNELDAINFWTKYRSIPNAIVSQDIFNDIDQYGEELVKFAMENGIRNDCERYSYVHNTLSKWDKAGIKTVKLAKQYTNGVVSGGGYGYNNQRSVIVPDYMNQERATTDKERIAKIKEYIEQDKMTDELWQRVTEQDLLAINTAKLSHYQYPDWILDKFKEFAYCLEVTRMIARRECKQCE